MEYGIDIYTPQELDYVFAVPTSKQSATKQGFLALLHQEMDFLPKIYDFKTSLRFRGSRFYHRI